MILSFNEIEAIALKAARGAGASWGLAEEAAFAARWLAERGFDWASLVLARCQADVGEAVRINGGDIVGEAVCPLRVGAFLADSGIPAGGISIRELAVPMLVLPFIARAGASPIEVRIGPEFVASFDAEGLAVSGAPPKPAASASVSVRRGARGTNATPMTRHSRPLPVATAVLQALAEFERRTYVPATDQSRLAGAGAGLSDND